MSEIPKPFVICPSVIEENEYEICNVLYTDPCEDCPIPIKLADIISDMGKEGGN